MIDFESLGIPNEVWESLKNKAIVTKNEATIKHTPSLSYKTIREPHPTIPNRWVNKGLEKVWTHNFRLIEKVPLFGIGGLNLLLSWMKESGYALSEKVESTYIFKSDKQTDFVTYNSETNKIGFDKPISDMTFKWQSSTNGVRENHSVTFTPSEIAEKLGISLTTLQEKLGGWKWNLVAVNTDTHVANAFSVLAKEDGVVTGDLLVNGVTWRNYVPFGKLVFPFGKAGQDFVVDWVLYNDHTASTPPKWTSEGNFGEAARTRIADKNDPRAFVVNVAETDGEAFYEADTHTFHYNPTKQSLLAIMPTLKPAQGKNDDHECLIDLNTGKVYYSRFEALRESKGVVKESEIVNPNLDITE